MYQNPKSATTAGLLGIFLGSVGAHNWYLGEKNKGIIHACLAGVSFLTLIVVNLILPATLGIFTLLSMADTLYILNLIAWLIAVGNGIWALVEGIILLSQGDAGLARKGYQVATPPMQPNYGPQPMNGFNGQPMNNGFNNMPGNMNGQMNGNPMNGNMPNDMNSNMNNMPQNNPPMNNPGNQNQ